MKGLWFATLLCATLGVYSLTYRRPALRNTFLFLFSLVFCYMVSPFLLGCAIIATLINHGLGLWIEKNVKRARRLATHHSGGSGVLIIGVILNLSLYGMRILLPETFEPFSGPVRFPLTSIALSFLVLQAISYLADVKRQNTPASRNLIETGLLLCFFPKFLCGPLVRANDFLPQLKKSYMLSSTEFSQALGLILLALVQRAVAYALDPQLITGLEPHVAAYAHTLCLYLNLAAYSGIALGSALLFDIHLPQNFRSPYKACSLTDFWRRWHISLSGWVRDYLYIPLGGNRHGALRLIAALLISFLAAGLWHRFDAGMAIVAIANGLLLSIEKLFRWDVKVERNRLTRILGWLATFHIITFSWLVLLTPSVETALSDLSRTVEVTQLYRPFYALLLIVFILILCIKERRKQGVARWFTHSPLWLQFIAALGIALLLLYLYGVAPQDFL